MKILVIRLSALGDILLTTGPLKLLKSQNEALEIHLLTSEVGDEVYRNSIAVKKVHILKKGIGFFELIKFYKNLERYDMIFDLQAKPKTSLLRFFSKAAFYQVEKKSKERRAFVKNRSFKNELSKHVVQRYYECFQKGFNLKDVAVEFLRPSTRAQSLTYKTKNFDFANSVAIHPYASQKNKVWPHTLELVESLKKLGLSSVIVGCDTENFSHEDLPTGTLNLTNKTSLSEMASIINSCKALISSDSGPMHMGVALNKPTLTLFGPTTEEFGFYPEFKNTKVVEVESLDCRPCHVHGGNTCPLGHHKCMRDISVDQVIETLKAIL